LEPPLEFLSASPAPDNTSSGSSTVSASIFAKKFIFSISDVRFVD